MTAARLSTMLFFLALIVRVAALFVRHEYLPPVPSHVVGAEAGAIAQHLLHGEGFASPFDSGDRAPPSTHLPPLFPIFLASLYFAHLSDGAVFYVALVLNVLASALLPVIVLQIGLGGGLSRKVAAVAGVAMCFCPEALRAVGLVWDEALFTTLAAAMVWWMLKQLIAAAPSIEAGGDLPRPVTTAVGLFNGLLALLNPAMVLAIPFAWLAGLGSLRMDWKRIALHAVILAATTFVASSPWHIRNWLILRPPALVFIRGNFWLEVWSNLHPIGRLTRPDGSVQIMATHPWPENGTEKLVNTDTNPPTPLTEQEYFAWCKERAIAAFRDNPRLIITHVAAQFDGFWLGTAEARRWAKNPGVFFLAQGVPALLAIIALYLNRKRLPPVSVAVFCAILIVYPLPYYLTAGAARYRHPIDGIIYLGAATLIVCYQRKKKPA